MYGWIGSRVNTESEEDEEDGVHTKMDSGGRYTCFDEASFLMHGKPFGLK